MYGKQLATTYPSRFRYTLNFAQYLSLSKLRPRKRYFRFHHGTSMDITFPNNTDLANGWINAINERWLSRFQAGTVLTVDETMFSWVGLCGDLHLTFLPRKPHPLGWMLKTTACAITRVYMRMELAMCAARMKACQWWKHTHPNVPTVEENEIEYKGY